MNLNNFGPFKADVWGTVSDWTYVLVAAVTGFLIWRTLRSQQRVQSLQQRLTEIESHRFRESIKPKFDLKIKSTKEITQIPDHQTLDVSFTLSAINHVAIDVAVDIQAVNDFDFRPDSGLPQKYDKIIPGVSPILKGTANYPSENHKEKGSILFNFDVIFEYQDSFENHYKQIIRCVFDDSKGLVIPAEAFFIP